MHLPEWPHLTAPCQVNLQDPFHPTKGMVQLGPVVWQLSKVKVRTWTTLLHGTFCGAGDLHRLCYPTWEPRPIGDSGF